MKSTAVFLLLVSISFFARAQQPPPASPPSGGGYETPPVLSAAAILQPAFDMGPNFQVRDPVPTYAGANSFTIDSDFGVFDAEGNDMLMRRVREIDAIAQLRAMSGTQEFARAVKKAAESPLVAVRDLITNPVGTVTGVPRGIWKFLNQTGETVKEIGEGRESSQPPGTVAQNMLGFSRVKRDIALRLGVDPYSTNEVFQKELNKVAWPAFAGGFAVDLGMFAVTGPAGIALSAANWTGNLNDLLRENSPADLRLLNLGLLLKMSVPRPDADAFLNNNALSPTAQTIIVAVLAQLGGATGRDAFLRQATTAADEQDALFFQQAAQLMALVNETMPVVLITRINGLPVCQTNDGTVIVPVEWDYLAWTPNADRFITALKAANFPTPPAGYALVITGVVSPMSAQALTARGVKFAEKQLANPLN